MTTPFAAPTTTPAFTEAIARDPAEHSARDLYVEWLEEDWQPPVCRLRAELIRAQVELARCGPKHRERRFRRPEQWVIPPHDEARIRELIAAETWPRGWDGTEPGADEPMHEVRRDGTIQLNLLAEW